jgi:hypothetical protein
VEDGITTVAEFPADPEEAGLMNVFRIKDDTHFMGLVPTDRAEAKALHDYDTGLTNDFPIRTLTRSIDEDNPDKPTADCFLLYGIGTPMFRENAKEILEEVLQGDGILYPCQTTEGRFFAFKVTRLIDALDYQRSEIEFAYSMRDKKKYPRVVRRYFLDIEKIGAAAIFKLPEFPLTDVYVTDVFRERYVEARLTGLLFHKVFPLPSREEQRKEQEQEFLSKRHKKKSRGDDHGSTSTRP